ncbi:hypothetical protein K488DRAFT_82340 [Vararia minispora EC-137]|uniref:Uncharacterized protein n=1 Tax=Vararia minispora EC-137 TaxID=1314806 RepID=A0ACB8QY09_9AGAM|nr:hypothetical protein K488DRAFT_82340 [Vararia minispora EC-137]
MHNPFSRSRTPSPGPGISDIHPPPEVLVPQPVMYPEQVRPDSYTTVRPTPIPTSTMGVLNYSNVTNHPTSVPPQHVPPGLAPDAGKPYNLGRKSSVFGDDIASDLFNLVFYTIPKEIYFILLLRLPQFYFSRVKRVFDSAELSQNDIERIYYATAQEWQKKHRKKRVSVSVLPNLNWDGSGMDGEGIHITSAMRSFKASWEEFIDSLLREWSTLNIISALLVAAILTLLTLDGAPDDPLTRTASVISLICALMSILYACLYIIRFGPMRQMHKAVGWTEEAKWMRKSRFWNVWALLAMPAVWLAWSLISFIAAIMSYVWRTHSDSSPTERSTSDRAALGIRISVSSVLALGVVFFVAMLSTFSKYGERMDAEWKRKKLLPLANKAWQARYLGSSYSGPLGQSSVQRPQVDRLLLFTPKTDLLRWLDHMRPTMRTPHRLSVLVLTRTLVGTQGSTPRVPGIEPSFQLIKRGTQLVQNPSPTGEQLLPSDFTTTEDAGGSAPSTREDSRMWGRRLSPPDDRNYMPLHGGSTTTPPSAVLDHIPDSGRSSAGPRFLTPRGQTYDYAQPPLSAITERKEQSDFPLCHASVPPSQRGATDGLRDAWSPFDPFKIDAFATDIPPLPIVLGYRGVGQYIWDSFIQDLKIAWRDRQLSDGRIERSTGAAVVETLDMWNEHFSRYRAAAVLGERTTDDNYEHYSVFFYDRFYGVYEAFQRSYAAAAPDKDTRLVLLVNPPPWSERYRMQWTFIRPSIPNGDAALQSHESPPSAYSQTWSPSGREPTTEQPTPEAFLPPLPLPADSARRTSGNLDAGRDRVGYANGMCPECGVLQTRTHILDSCPRYASARRPNFLEFLKNSSSPGDELYRFCKDNPTAFTFEDAPPTSALRNGIFLFPD